MPAISKPEDRPSPTTSGTNSNEASENNTITTTPLPIRKHTFPTPKLRLQFEDLKHPGASVFLSALSAAATDIETQIQNVLNLLYHTPTSPRPPTRSITFVIEDMPGVAYTTGTALDDDHKEIHISLAYINLPKHNKGDAARYELLGVICHELVHCFQYNACGSAPGGLIEGIADWVRLNAGLAAKHWKQEAEGDWDKGYQHTGYFLQWLEVKFGEGTVRRINAALREGGYDERRVFRGACAGREVGALWEEYAEELRKKRERDGEKGGEEGTGTGEAVIVPTDTPPKIEGERVPRT